MLGLQPFTIRLYRQLAAWLLPVALNTGKGSVLVATLLEEMRQRRIILPPLAVSECLSSEVRSRAERQTFPVLTRDLSEANLENLDGLLRARPGNGSQNWLAWLRQPKARRNVLEAREGAEGASPTMRETVGWLIPKSRAICAAVLRPESTFSATSAR